MQIISGHFVNLDTFFTPSSDFNEFTNKLTRTPLHNNLEKIAGMNQNCRIITFTRFRNRSSKPVHAFTCTHDQI